MSIQQIQDLQLVCQGLILWLGTFHPFFFLKNLSAHIWSANWHFFYHLRVFLGQFALIVQRGLYESLAKFPCIYQTGSVPTLPSCLLPSKNGNVYPVKW